MDSKSGASLSAEGDSEPPDKMRLNVEMGALGNLETIQIGKQSYTKLAGQDSYVQTESTGGSNIIGGLGGATDPEGFANFTQNADSVSVVGDEKVDGVDTTHISFAYDLDKAMESGELGTDVATPGASMGKANGDVWIEKSTNYIRKLKLVTPGGILGGAEGLPGAASDTPTTGSGTTNDTITIEYSKINEPIAPPIEARQSHRPEWRHAHNCSAHSIGEEAHPPGPLPCGKGAFLDLYLMVMEASSG